MRRLRKKGFIAYKLKMENHKKWQNLLHGKCPKCDSRLNIRKDKTIIYECETEGCGFLITDRAYAGILSDKTHIMRRFLTPHETELLEEALKDTKDFIIK